MCLENYLRCMTSHKPIDGKKWVLLVEFLYNSNYHLTTKLTPFKALYEYDPPHLYFELISQSRVAIVD